MPSHVSSEAGSLGGKLASQLSYIASRCSPPAHQHLPMLVAVVTLVGVFDKAVSSTA